MNRREILATMAVAAGAHGTAWAQAQPNTGAGAPESGRMGELEMKHAQQTLALGAVALESSRVALQKARNAWVKKFANYEIAEQETMAEVLKSLGASAGQPDEKGAAMITKLQNAKSDPSFDRDYMAAQIDGHRDLLKVQEDYIAAGKDVHQLALAKLARGQIKQHIDFVETLQKQFGRG